MCLGACKDSDEKAPIANFEFVKSVIFEGNNLEIKNNSINGSCQWLIEELNLKSENFNYNPFMDSIGTFNLKLRVTNGNGLVSEVVKPFTVLVDSFYRICNRKSKVWQIQSLIVDNLELIDKPCKEDDVLVLNYYNSLSIMDSFFINHGITKCDPQDYLIQMPANGLWQWNTKRKTLNLNIVVINDPMVFNFKFTKLYTNYAIAEDGLNNAKIKLIKL